MREAGGSARDQLQARILSVRVVRRTLRAEVQPERLIRQRANPALVDAQYLVVQGRLRELVREAEAMDAEVFRVDLQNMEHVAVFIGTLDLDACDGTAGELKHVGGPSPRDTIISKGLKHDTVIGQEQGA